MQSESSMKQEKAPETCKANVTEDDNDPQLLREAKSAMQDADTRELDALSFQELIPNQGSC